MTTSSLFLLGIVLIIRDSEKKFLGVALMAIGFVATNLLTYGGLFLLGVGGLIVLFDFFKNKKTVGFIGLLISVLTFLGVLLILKNGFHYDHIEGFFVSSKIENPNGFRLFSNPGNYLLTRIENISEIGFFLSFAILSILAISSFNLKFWRKLFNNDFIMIAILSLITLLLVFLTGAYRTGETARACLFIYPFLLLLLINKDTSDYSWMILFAGIQTSIMQIFFGYYW